MLRNIFLENEGRYQFATKFKPKIVFDFEKNTIFDLSGAKILLENGASEIIKCNEINNVRRYCSRKKDEKNNINFELLQEFNEIKNKKIDTLLSFESIKSKEYYLKIIDEFLPILSKEGKLIISVLNSACLKIQEINDKRGCTKKELVQILKEKFQTVEIYSQKNLTKDEINHIQSESSLFLDDLSIRSNEKKSLIKKMRRKLGKSLEYFDKSGTIYVKYFQKTINQLNNKNEEKISRSAYIPIPFKEEHTPLFFVVVCKNYKNKT